MDELYSCRSEMVEVTDGVHSVSLRSIVFEALLLNFKLEVHEGYLLCPL